MKIEKKNYSFYIDKSISTGKRFLLFVSEYIYIMINSNTFSFYVPKHLRLKIDINWGN
jgi:hypothetical protein